MKKTQKQLYEIWQKNSGKPGWLREIWLSGECDKGDLVELERIDDEFLEFAKKEEKKWQEWNWKNLPKIEEGWLKIFPEAKKIIPNKIKEYKEKEEKLTEVIRKKLQIIKEKGLDEFSYWFWREWVKITDGEELLKTDGHIARLKRLLSVAKGRVPKGRLIERQIQQALAVPIETILNQPLRKGGKALVGLCPFHPEKHPSFYIYPETNSCWCYGCNQGGNVINFVMLFRGLSFPDAVRWLLGDK